jgi:alkylhydroperoxidase family enzyme
MVMAQGQLSRKQMQSILDDPEGSDLINEKTKGLIRLATKMTKESYKIIHEDIESLRILGLSDEMILESIHVIAFFNYLDRMADATGAPVENLQEMMAKMT